MDKTAALQMLSQAIADGIERAESKDKPKAKDIQARVLVDMLAEVRRPCPFVIGDLVEQDMSREAYRWPGAGELAIVTDVFAPKPTLEAKDREFREDITILCLCDGTWQEFRVASWRFKKYMGTVA